MIVLKLLKALKEIIDKEIESEDHAQSFRSDMLSSLTPRDFFDEYASD
jgi:hypothetical protein